MSKSQSKAHSLKDCSDLASHISGFIVYPDPTGIKQTTLGLKVHLKGKSLRLGLQYQCVPAGGSKEQSQQNRGLDPATREGGSTSAHVPLLSTKDEVDAEEATQAPALSLTSHRCLVSGADASGSSTELKPLGRAELR